MELKLFMEGNDVKLPLGSNRTFMELKYWLPTDTPSMIEF